MYKDSRDNGIYEDDYWVHIFDGFIHVGFSTDDQVGYLEYLCNMKQYKNQEELMNAKNTPVYPGWIRVRMDVYPE